MKDEAKIFKFTGDKKYHPEDDMKNEIEDVIGKFAGMMGICSAIGVIRLIEADLIEQSRT